LNQIQLDRAVAAATGESLRTIHALGFGRPAELEPEDLALCVDCPFCGAAVPAPAPLPHADHAPAFAECARCDVAFDCGDDEVYAAAAAAVAA